MRKLDIARAVAQQLGIPLKDAKVAVEATFQAVTEGLIKHRKVAVRGLGTWTIRRREARMARVPSTGEKVRLPVRYVPFFKASKQFAEKINSAG